MQCVVLEVAAGVSCMVSQERLRAFCFVFFSNKYGNLSHRKSSLICFGGEIYSFVVFCFLFLFLFLFSET